MTRGGSDTRLYSFIKIVKKVGLRITPLPGERLAIMPFIKKKLNYYTYKDPVPDWFHYTIKCYEEKPKVFITFLFYFFSDLHQFCAGSGTGADAAQGSIRNSENRKKYLDIRCFCKNKRNYKRHINR